MKHFAYLFLVLCLLIISATIKAAPATGEVEFAESYLSGRELSKKVDKPLLVYFYDDNNIHCGAVDKLWHDEEIADLASSQYICSRVNIHHFDGETLQKYHKINEAPALILLSPQGKIIRRINSDINKADLLAFLNGTAISNNGTTIKNNSETAVPKPSGRSSGSFVPSSRNHTQSSSTAIVPPAATENVQHSTTESYTIQIGVYSSKENAETRIAELRRMFNEPIKVISDSSGNKTLYRVVLGEFSSMNESKDYLQLVNKYGIEGFVKSLPL